MLLAARVLTGRTTKNSSNKTAAAKTPAVSPPTELVLMYVGSPITSDIKSLSWSPQL